MFLLYTKIWWFNNKISSLFQKRISKKIECCVYIMHGKFKTDECFLFMKSLKLETFENCKEVSSLLKKIHSTFLLTPPPTKKFKNCKFPSFCQHWKFFRPMQKRGANTVAQPSKKKMTFILSLQKALGNPTYYFLRLFWNQVFNVIHIFKDLLK